jgi:predicted porin
MFEYADIGFKQGNQTAALEQNGHNKGYSIGYSYDFSKRTALYAFVSSIKFDSDTVTTTGLTSTSPIAAAGGALQGVAVAGERGTYLSTGIRHFF